MINIGTLIATLQLKDKLTPALVKAQQSIKNVGPKLKNLGSTLTKNVTLGMAAAAAATLMASDTIQKAFRAISSTTGATGDALEGLTDSFTEVFTQVPQGAEVVAGALADINTISGATGSVLESLTKNVLDASRMLGENAGPNAIGFARALEQFQRPAIEGTDILDRFFRISQETGSGLGDLIRQTNEYGGVLKNAGFSMEESAVLFGRLESSGISVSRVMPGLNAAFRKSADAGENSRAMLDRVINSMKAAKSDTQALSIATEVFGAEGAQRMTVAVRNGTFALDDLTSSLSGAEGGIQAASAESQTLSEVMGTLRNKATSALAPFGDELKVVLLSFLPLIESLGEHIKDASFWFSQLSPAAKKTIVVITGLTAAAGPLLFIVGQLAIAFGAISLPVLAVVVAVGAAVTALFVFRKEIMDFIDKGINFLVDGFQKAKVALGFMTEAEYKAAKAQREAAQVANENAKAIKAVTDKLKGQQPVQRDVIAKVEDHTGKVKELTEAQKKYRKEINDQVIAWRTGGIPQMKQALAVYQEFGGTLETLSDDHLRDLADDLEAGIDTLRRNGEAIPQEATELWMEVLDLLRLRLGDTTTALKGFQTTANKPFFPPIAQISLENAIGHLETLEPIPPKISGKLEGLKKAAGRHLGGLNGIFKSAFEGGGGMKGAIESFITGVLEDLLRTIPVVGEVLAQFAGTFVAAAKAIWKGMKRFFGGPSDAELAARELTEAFEDELIEGLNKIQLEEAAGRRWAMVVISVRDSYLKAGKSADDAERAVQRLWDATKLGPEAVQAAIDAIEEVRLEAARIEEMENNWRGAEEAAKRYGISLDDLGDKYKAAKWAEEAKQLADDWELLSMHGENVNKIAKKMAPTVQEMIDKYQEAGIAIPDNMKPMIEKMIDLGLLTDAEGNALTDMSALDFATPLVDQVETLVMSIQELVDMLKGTLMPQFDDVENYKFADKTFTVTAEYESNMAQAAAAAASAQAQAGFQGGTHGRFVDFGKGTSAILHGKERIVTEQEGRDAVLAQSERDAEMLEALTSIRTEMKMLPRHLRDALILSQ